MAVSFDLFSLLPESLLLLILSLLPFKDAVTKSVLSKRWLHAVKSLNQIQLHEEYFVQRGAPQEDREAQRNAFLSFATSWMDRYEEPTIKKFSLKLSMPGNAIEFIERFISFVTERKLKESLEVDFSNPNWDGVMGLPDEHVEGFELPSIFYEQIADLEFLKLYSCSFYAINAFRFHALKEVSLGWMVVTNVLLRVLLSKCQMLESLSLKRCRSRDVFDLAGDGDRLRKLVIDRCRFHIDFIRLNVPLLTVFKYSGLMSYFLVEADLPLLEEAEVDFSREQGFLGHGPFLYDIVEGLSSAKVLTVCGYLLQYVSNGGQLLRIERDMNVKHLILKTGLHENEYFGIAFMLNSCPMLERLTIELRPTNIWMNYAAPQVSHKIFWRDNVSGYTCLVSTLKEVEVKGFRGSMNEVVLLIRLITYGKALKKMYINVLKDDEEDNGEDGVDWGACRAKVAEVLMIAQKASSDLEIIIT